MQPSWTVCIMVLVFFMLMALLSSILRMQEFFIAGIDTSFPWCAKKATYRCTWSKCPKICIVFNFIQNSELTCFFAIFWYAFEVLLFLVFQFVVKICLDLCLSALNTPVISMISKQQSVSAFSSVLIIPKWPGCILYSMFCLPSEDFVCRSSMSLMNGRLLRMPHITNWGFHWWFSSMSW